METVYHQEPFSDNTYNVLFSSELYAASILYAKRLNCETFPVINKIPANGHQWRTNKLGYAGAHPATLDAWQSATGFAVAPIDGDTLTIIDIDHPAFYSTVIVLLPILKETFTIQRGQNNCHIYIRLSKPLPQAYLTHKDIDNSEVASLRGAGSYVVGPYSDHPSGDKYIPRKGSQKVVQLDEQQTTLLLNLFTPPLPDEFTQPDPDKNQLILDHKHQINKRLIQELTELYLKIPRSYTRTDRAGDIWINTSCPLAEYHKHGDNNPSFGLNTSKGYGKCFHCNKIFSIKHLARLASIDVKRLGGLFDRPESDRPKTEMLTAAGASQSRMISDFLDADMRPALTRSDLLEMCNGLGWSKSKSYKAIQSAVDHNRITEIGEGIYQRKTAIIRGKLRYDDSAYKKHVINYRLAVTLDIQEQCQKEVLQSPNGISSPFSADKIARRVGVSKATLYRYESPKRLSLEKHRLYARFDLPPNADHQLRILSQARSGTKLFIDVISRRGHTIQRIDPHSYKWDDPGSALSHAKALAYRWRGKPVLCEQRPSIRLLPGQSIKQILPLGSVLSRSGNVYLDSFESLSMRVRAKNGDLAKIQYHTHPFNNFNQLLENASQGVSNRTKSNLTEIKGFTSASIAANTLLLKAQEMKEKTEWKDKVGYQPSPAKRSEIDAKKTPEQLLEEKKSRESYWQKRDDFIANNRRNRKQDQEP